MLRIVQDEMADLADGGLTEQELERAKGHMKGSLVLSLEDTSGRMSRIGKSEISHGEILSVDEVLERIDAVTFDDAVRTAREVFRQPMALTVVGPFGRRRSTGSPWAAWWRERPDRARRTDRPGRGTGAFR